MSQLTAHLRTHPLRAWRLTQKPPLSQAELAEIVGSTKATISRIESRLQDPKVALIRKIVAATAGAVTAEDLVKQTPTPREIDPLIIRRRRRSSGYHSTCTSEV
jgi:transcriptional regulator with XRE-family HTH domain